MSSYHSGNLLPEEDAIDDPEDEDEADPTIPGDLWFRFPASSRSTEPRGTRRILAFGQAAAVQFV
jgi:hypothetical protein